MLCLNLQTPQSCPTKPNGWAPTFRSRRSWSKASTLRLCRGRVDLWVENRGEGLQEFPIFDLINSKRQALGNSQETSRAYHVVKPTTW